MLTFQSFSSLALKRKLPLRRIRRWPSRLPPSPLPSNARRPPSSWWRQPDAVLTWFPPTDRDAPSSSSQDLTKSLDRRISTGVFTQFTTPMPGDRADGFSGLGKVYILAWRYESRYHRNIILVWITGLQIFSGTNAGKRISITEFRRPFVMAKNWPSSRLAIASSSSTDGKKAPDSPTLLDWFMLRPFHATMFCFYRFSV